MKTRAQDVRGLDKRVDMATDIHMHTLNSAFASSEEGFKGGLEVGKAADLVVLTEGLSRLPVEQLRHVGLVMTVVDGEVVYEA